MSVEEVKNLTEIAVQLGLPGALAVAVVWFMLMHIRNEMKKEGSGQQDCPPWARQAKGQIKYIEDKVGNIVTRLDKLENTLTGELKEQESQSHERDRRQQRIENMLTEIRARLPGTRR